MVLGRPLKAERKTFDNAPPPHNLHLSICSSFLVGRWGAQPKRGVLLVPPGPSAVGVCEQVVSGGDFHYVSFLYRSQVKGNQMRCPEHKNQRDTLSFGAQAKSREKFGLKIMGFWDDSMATSVASGKSSHLCEPLPMGS